MSDDIVMLAMLATIHHRTGADPDKDYTHPYVIENYKYCKDLLCGMVDHARKIEARHNALRHNTKVIIKAYRENRKELAALRDAVAWERECEALWNDNTATTCDGAFEVEDSLDAARAEVDRLLGEK